MQLDTSDTAAIWNALADDLRRFIDRRIGDPVIADDLLQEVFLRVHRHRAELRQQTRVAGWVYRIARNVVTDHLRQQRRAVPLDAEPVDPGLPDEGEDDARAAAWVLGRWLATMIDTLPQPYREALTLTEVEGLSQREAAQRLGLSYSGLKSRVQRGRARLRALLDRCCEVELDASGSVVTYRPRRRGSTTGAGGCRNPADCC